LRLHLLHPLALPIVEVAHYFYDLAAEGPLENVLNFGPECILQVLDLNLRKWLLIHLIEVLSTLPSERTGTGQVLNHLGIGTAHGRLVEEVVWIDLIHLLHLGLQVLLLKLS
jgi:hypothetical protein